MFLWKLHYAYTYTYNYEYRLMYMKGTSQEEHNVFRFKFHLGFVLLMPNATFNNISAISRRSVVLVGETGENH
jgi:hypothetical protein